MYTRFGKRLFDILLLLATGPPAIVLMLVVAVAIRLSSGPPVLFRQKRVRDGERLFTLYKFRTMAPPPGGDPRAVRDEQRLGRLGRVLRRSSLDELPQLWNILRGEMSFVGPRPLLDIYIPRYAAHERLRHSVPQGLTGWSQVTSRNAALWSERFEQDLWYLRHRSFALDLKILLLTVGKVLSRTGVSKPGHTTCDEFLGYSHDGQSNDGH
ncbi:MAG TPA: sugar transferase [Bryobacteraceae bacterium]|nr:sugar transferase [Bryobacteraceae bacterium]